MATVIRLAGAARTPGGYWLYAQAHPRGMTPVVHRATCQVCNHGDGIHRRRPGIRNHWLGPFEDLDEAFLAAELRTGREPHRCQLCFP